MDLILMDLRKLLEKEKSIRNRVLLEEAISKLKEFQKIKEQGKVFA